MGKTKDLFKKLQIPRENFMQIGTIKDRNGMDLTEAEEINKRWQEYTERQAKYILRYTKNIQKRLI